MTVYLNIIKITDLEDEETKKFETDSSSSAPDKEILDSEGSPSEIE